MNRASKDFLGRAVLLGLKVPLALLDLGEWLAIRALRASREFKARQELRDHRVLRAVPDWRGYEDPLERWVRVDLAEAAEQPAHQEPREQQDQQDRQDHQARQGQQSNQGQQAHQDPAEQRDPPAW